MPPLLKVLSAFCTAAATRVKKRPLAVVAAAIMMMAALWSIHRVELGQTAPTAEQLTKSILDLVEIEAALLERHWYGQGNPYNL